MLDPVSQWNLLADCAKDWGFSSESHDEIEHKHNGSNFSMEEFDLSWQDKEIEESSVRLTHYTNLSESEEKSILRELVSNPKNANLWRLCLMAYGKDKFADLDNSLENPLEGVEAWLVEGIKKGWLRREERQYNLPLIEYPLFEYRLSADCHSFGKCFSVVVFRVNADSSQNDLLLQCFAKYLTTEDYLCEIKGVGYILVLAGRKSFAASAVMEKIADNYEKKLLANGFDTVFSVGLAEFCQGDTVETLLDHAKQALAMPSPIGIKVKSYIINNQQKREESSSIVHSNEKRFLFFGI